MVEIIANRNCVYQTAYHIIWCPKYRKDILTGQVSERLHSILENISSDHSWPIITKEIQPDHIHLFVSIPPSVSVSEAVKMFKGISARKLFLHFPFLKRSFGAGICGHHLIMLEPLEISALKPFKITLSVQNIYLTGVNL